MGALSPMHLAIVAVLALIAFGGRGKLSALMGDAAQGLKAFKNGLKDDPAPEAQVPRAEADKTVSGS